MEKRTSTLELVPRTYPGGAYKRQSHYLDFIVDGHSLGELLEVGDSVGCLGWSGWNNSEDEQELADVLLLRHPASLPTGRAMLYVCAECGDIGCGAYTVQVEETQEYIIWHEFGYENDYDLTSLDLTTYSQLGPFYFDKTDYANVIALRSGTETAHVP